MSLVFRVLTFVSSLIALPGLASAAASAPALSRADYADRVEAVWTGQIAAMLVAWPFEHRVAAAQRVTDYPRPYETAIVDDDWYYEMSAVRGFEKYGVDMTVAELGRQWLEDGCGAWGSSREARLNLERGIDAIDSGHPRYNKLWFSIGPQFSADVYGALAPGMVNVAARLARELGRINGYAEGVDGAVFVAGMISLGFVERDPKLIVRQAARLIHLDSPYRQCLDEVIRQAEAGRGFEEIAGWVEDRWHIEYPATNNAVANGGLTALSVWFGGGDFLDTVNLAARAADFTDADCNAASSAAVVGAMHGMKAIPVHLIPRENAVLRFEAGVDAGRAWELAVYVNDRQIVKRVIDGLGANATKWETIEVDLREFAGRETELRLHQHVIVRNRTAGNAYWKALRVE